MSAPLIRALEREIEALRERRLELLADNRELREQVAGLLERVQRYEGWRRTDEPASASSLATPSSAPRKGTSSIGVGCYHYRPMRGLG